MRKTPIFKLASKGAALVEYVALIALIGVVLMTVVLRMGANVSGTFAESNTTIRDETGLPPVDVGGGTPDDTDTPIGPDIPLFPPPTEPDSGIEHQFTYDVYFSYRNTTSITFDQVADAIEADAGTWYYNAAPPANWQNDVTWTGLERSDPDVPFPYNETVFTTSALSHNTGPLPGWGVNPEGIDNCLAAFPTSDQYQLRGHIGNGDRILIYLNLPPAPCAPSIDVSHDVSVAHNSGGYGLYGDITNFEAAANGPFPGVPNNLDWNAATWSTVPGTVDIYDNGMVFSGLAFTSDRYQYNLLAGPAWHYSSDPSGEATACRETPYTAYATVRGIHPDGYVATLALSITPFQNAESSDRSDCFEAFGP